MKEFISAVTFLLLSLNPLHTSLAQTNSSTNTQQIGMVLIAGIADLCFNTRETVKTNNGKGLNSPDFQYQTALKESLELAIKPALKNFNHPIPKCKKEDYLSNSMATLSISTSISEFGTGRDQYKIRVTANLAERFKSLRTDAYARAYLINSVNVTYTRGKDKLDDLAIEKAVGLINHIAEVFVENRP